MSLKLRSIMSISRHKGPQARPEHPIKGPGWALSSPETLLTLG
ncbi:hypothetical protein [Lysobacter gummosus]